MNRLTRKITHLKNSELRISGQKEGKKAVKKEEKNKKLNKSLMNKVFENRVLRRVFGPKRDEVTGEWRKLHNEELNDLYSLPNIVRVVKSRRMRWTGHVVRMGKDRDVHGVLGGEA